MKIIIIPPLVIVCNQDVRWQKTRVFSIKKISNIDTHLPPETTQGLSKEKSFQLSYPIPCCKGDEKIGFGLGGMCLVRIFDFFE